MKARGTSTASPPSLKVIFGDLTDQQCLQFAQPFRIGRADECEVCVQDEYVSRVHAEVVFENGNWWLRDLQSSNGIYLAGQRVERTAISRPMEIRLGIEGPQISFEPELLPPPGMLSTDKIKAVGSGTILRQYVEHYFSKSANHAPAGEHTAYVRRAFAKVQTQQKRTYAWIIAALLLVAVGAGGYALYEHRQLQRQRALAEDLFYAMKSLDIDIANVQRAVSESDNPQGVQLVRRYASRRKEMRDNYEQYLATLHVYDRKMTEEQRILLRVARIFGECELDMPRDFEAEVNKYIKYWQQSGRLATAIRTAQQNGYVDTISKELLDHGLPPQFFYLALQESNFDPYVSGPVTRKGIAKGMWQFVPETAIKYGLKVGPLADLRRPDPGDERDQYEKATKAAARYLKDLYSTDAQASGILVMACYNWGEDQVLPLVRSMPANPRERNFWRLLAHHRDKIPQETYDYVFYIVSAAVIGENPRLFGFDFDNPLAKLEGHQARAAMAIK
jgi:membrane-bound lytic murein transglycosylase D